MCNFFNMISCVQVIQSMTSSYFILCMFFQIDMAEFKQRRDKPSSSRREKSYSSGKSPDYDGKYSISKQSYSHQYADSYYDESPSGDSSKAFKKRGVSPKSSAYYKDSGKAAAPYKQKDMYSQPYYKEKSRSLSPYPVKKGRSYSLTPPPVHKKELYHDYNTSGNYAKTPSYEKADDYGNSSGTYRKSSSQFNKPYDSYDDKSSNYYDGKNSGAYREKSLDNYGGKSSGYIPKKSEYLGGKSSDYVAKNTEYISKPTNYENKYDDYDTVDVRSTKYGARNYCSSPPRMDLGGRGRGDRNTDYFNPGESHGSEGRGGRGYDSNFGLNERGGRGNYKGVNNFKSGGYASPSYDYQGEYRQPNQFYSNRGGNNSTYSSRYRDEYNDGGSASSTQLSRYSMHTK